MPSIHNASTNWVFTLNNPTPADEQALLEYLPFKYLIFQYELSESETMHIQGYVVLDRRLRLPALKKLHNGVHWEVRRGTHEQAVEYCSKKDTHIAGPYIYGTDEGIAKKRGQRSDLLAVKAKIDQGVPMEDIWDQHFATTARYHKSFEVYKDVKSKHRHFEQGEKPKVVILWGPSGTGKSTKAKKDYPDAYWLTKPSQVTSTVWWQGYEGQTTVVLDEFYGWIQYDLLLRMLDYYAVTVEKKGGSAKLAAKTFVFTSNSHPDDWYKKVKDTTALKRRISEFGTIQYLGETFNTENSVLEVPAFQVPIPINSEETDGYESETF